MAADRLAHPRREPSAARRPVLDGTRPALSATPVAHPEGPRNPGGGAPTILSHLLDAANLLTLAGLASTISAVVLAVRGTEAGAAVSLVAAFVFDVVDGPVAKRSARRTAEQGAFGASLDSLADMASAGVALGVVVLSYGHFRVGYAVVAVILACATALRLSFFNVHGLDPQAGTYTGVPTDMAIISFVAVMLLDVPLPASAFRLVLGAWAVVVAGLMVSPLRIPKITGRWYGVQIALAVVLAACQAARLVV